MEPRSRSSRLGRAGVAAAAAFLVGLGAAQAVSAQPGGTMTIDSSTEHYRQQAVEGARRHDFSPASPPGSGRFVYGHWTPYDPPDPSMLPPGRQHVIRSGDTLWDISIQYLQDPLLWPYIWEANSWITWPHWIYPGDVLVLPDLFLVPDGSLEDVARFDDILEGFYPGAWYDDTHCGHFIASPNRKWHGEIIDQEDDPPAVVVSLDDVVYVDVGAQDGVLPGDELAIIHPRQHFDVSVVAREKKRQQVEHPLSGEKLGVVMQMTGRLKIILLGESVSTARITYACGPIEIGYDLVPFTEAPVPLVRRHEREKYFNEMARRGRGFVVWAREEQVMSGDGALVSIDLGSHHGVLPGDLFRIYRDFPVDFFDEDTDYFGDWFDKQQGLRRMKRKRDPTEVGTFGRDRRIPDSPPRVLGELVVIYTERDTATARVLTADKEVIGGDRVVYMPVDAGLASVPTFVPPRQVQPRVPLSRQVWEEEDSKDAHPDRED